MIGDYLTNPLQGSLFRNFHNLILGIEEADVTKYNTKAHEWIKEREQKKSALTKTFQGWWMRAQDCDGIKREVRISNTYKETEKQSKERGKIICGRTIKCSNIRSK